MAISVIFPPDPQQAGDALLAGLRARATALGVYSLGLSRIQNGPRPGDDLFAGWWYLIGLDSNLAIVAQVAWQNERLSYAGLSYGPKTAKAVRAIQGVKASSGIPEGTYDLRVLRVQALQTDSLWLHSSQPGGGYVVPYDTVQQTIRVDANAPYTLDGFVNELRPLVPRAYEARLEI